MTSSEMLFDRELHGQIHDASGYMIMEKFSARQDVPSLNPNFTTTHGGLNHFPDSTMSAKKAIKLNPRQANNYIGKNRVDASTPKLGAKKRANPRPQLFATTPSVFTRSEEPTKRSAQARAANLKREYPDIEGVGDSITKKKRHKLLAQYRVSHPDVAIP